MEKKKYKKIPVVDLCDASTIVNYNLKDGDAKRKEDDIHWESDTELEANEVQTESVNKVQSWLENYTSLQAKTKENIEDSEWWSMHTWLSKDTQSNDFKEYISSNKKRLPVFLLTVTPDLNNREDSLEMVSGYCRDGCKGLHRYSSINWTKEQEKEVPLCPNNNCLELGSSKELVLTFMVELHVMDEWGYHSKLYVCQEHAELFFGCTVSDFINNKKQRQNKCENLRRYQVVDVTEKTWTPRLDVTIVPLKRIFFVVDTRLKVPKH